MKKIIKYLLAAAGCLLFTGVYAQRKDLVVYKDSTVVNFFRRTQGWIAGDGAFTVSLADGGTLWLTGDSHIDDYDKATGTIPCLFQVHNAALLQPAGDWDWTHTRTLVAKGPGDRSLFRDTSDRKSYFWPTSGIQLGDTIYVYYAGQEPAKGGLGFASTGRDMLVKIKFPEMEVVGYQALQDLNGIGFGDGFIKDTESDYVFVYGYKGDHQRHQSDMYVARFPANAPCSGWEFWNGKGWSAQPANAAPIAKDVRFTPMMCKVKNRYILVSSETSVGCDQGKDIYIATAAHPTGPFTAPRTIYTIDDTLQGHYPFFYVPVGHPELINDKQELLITYNVNGYGKCIEGCVNNRMSPDHYRPRGIRVPLKLIDPAW